MSYLVILGVMAIWICLVRVVCAEAQTPFEGEGIAGDGINLLPNPGFEQIEENTGRPAFWMRGGTGVEGYPVSAAEAPPGTVEMTYEDGGAHSSTHCVAVRCLSKEGIGAWRTDVSLAPGAWVFEGWYRTLGMQPEPRQGPVVRISALDCDGRVILHFYAFGTASEENWSSVRLPFDAPPGTVSVQVQLRNAWMRGTVYWDDVYLGEDAARRRHLQVEQEEDVRLLPEVQQLMPTARERVALLRETHVDGTGRLLVASLEWALDDTELAIEAQMGREAKATLDDVMDCAAHAEEIIGNARLPVADSERDGNPYVARLNADMEKLAQEMPVFRKGEVGYREIETSWTFRTVGQNASVLAWGLLHPRSDLQCDPRLLKGLLTHVQAMADHHIGGSVTPFRDSRDWNIDRFGLAPTLDALMQLEAALPWVILPSKRRAWRHELHEMVAYQYRTYGFRFYEHSPPDQPRLYPNMDVHYLLIMGIAHRMFEDDRYAVEAERFLEFMAEGLLPMGGWTYSVMQNEVYTYHRLNTMLLARYYQITGSERALDILDHSRPYYPLVHTPEGMVEHSTDVSWKHNWAAAAPGGAEVKAGLFECGENKRAALYAAQRAGHEGGITAVWAAPWWKDIEPAPPKDNWLVFDGNIQGPRGQFGKFSFAGTTRIPPGGGIGRDTFVGCMVGDAEAEGLPLDAALQIATIEYRTNPSGPHWDSARYHSGSERHSVMVASEFASMAVRYRITRPGWGTSCAEMPWEGVQQWFMSRNQLVGMLTLRPLVDTEAWGVWGRMNFGMDKVFEIGPENTYRYGSLLARIHQHNFTGIETGEAEVDPGIGPNSRELLLKDAVSLSNGAPTHVYRAGDAYFYVVEVFPNTSQPAKQVAAIREGPILGVAFGEAQQRFVVLHNQDTEPIVYRVPVDGATAMVFSPPGDAQEMAAINGKVAIEIPGETLRVVVDRK